MRARGRATGRAQNAQKRSGKAITSAVYRLPRTRETPAPAVARSSYDLQGQAARADGQGSGRGMAPKGRNPARMHQTAPECTQPHPTAPIEAHQNAPDCTQPHQTPPKPPERAVMQQNGGSPETSVPLRFVDFVRSPKNRACRYDSWSLCRGIPLSPGPSIPVRSCVSCDRRNTSVPVRFAVRRNQSPSIFRSGAGGVQAGCGRRSVVRGGQMDSAVGCG